MMYVIKTSLIETRAESMVVGLVKASYGVGAQLPHNRKLIMCLKGFIGRHFGVRQSKN
jgi:hypothetical protein